MVRFPPRSRAIVNGETIEFVVAGSGEPAVVLVNGSGGPLEGWHKVFGELAAFTTVLAYNRPGIGGSPQPAAPQTGSQMVATLRGLLAAAKVQPPCVFVGHSLGGLLVNLYARTHPQDVAAVVLLEATAPDDVAALAGQQSKLQDWVQRAMDYVSPQHPHAEARHIRTTLAEIQAAASFPPVPLIVVTGGRPAMAWATPREQTAARANQQRSLAALSIHGRQVLATRSGHFPQFSEPDLVVSVVEQAHQSAVNGVARGATDSALHTRL